MICHVFFRCISGEGIVALYAESIPFPLNKICLSQWYFGHGAKSYCQFSTEFIEFDNCCHCVFGQ